MSTQILLYDGPGVIYSDPLKKQLKELVDDRVHQIRPVKNLLYNLSDPRSIRSLLLPAGDAAQMKETLSSSREQIQNFVSQGKSVFVICAGGMVLCDHFHTRANPRYTTNDGTPVGNRNYFIRARRRYLGLFPGSILAPLSVCLSQVHTRNAIRLTKVQQTDKKIGTLTFANIYSPAFLDVEDMTGKALIKGAKVIAKYQDLPPIQLENDNLEAPFIDTGRLAETVLYQPNENSEGKYLLTGCHPELDSTAVLTDTFGQGFNLTKKQQTDLADQLRPDDQARRALLKSHLETVGITCKKDG